MYIPSRIISIHQQRRNGNQKSSRKIQHEGSKTHPDEENGEAILQMVMLEEGLSRLNKIHR